VPHHSKPKYTDAVETDNPALKGEVVTTTPFKAVKGGTEVKVVQAGIPKLIALEMAERGWGQSFNNLAALVEMLDMAGASAQRPEPLFSMWLAA